ncbi:HET-domain-containing protein [Lentithecium fluviatile CBS 122367]|uniref:HET-domain-containing protein n=1 Tax=Lentithecium fluviatile CBS 122367 TaxID=1168545 RepID=A0A6G1IUK7_9PLEO|nr:HET-domain-containing protein [Lentithecium fluviatile CBS 122367]
MQILRCEAAANASVPGVVACTFFSGLLSRSLPSTIQLCSYCSAIVAETHGPDTYTISVPDIRDSAKNCSICKMLLQAFQRFRQDGDGNINVERRPSALSLGARGPSVLRFCADPEYAVRADSKIPIGLPVLFEPNNPARFGLLRAWLRQCNRSHGCKKHQIKSESALPTRVLCVGNCKDLGHDSDFVRLVRASETRKQEYIALSHCWGGLSVEEKTAFCTTQDNINRRLEGFRLSELPKTFQGAVKVTQELSVLYLWVNSLCIIQYGDDSKD